MARPWPGSRRRSRGSPNLPAGAARNALDCAFIDLEAKLGGRPAHECLGLDPPHPLGTPDAMAAAAAAASARPLLKVKLAGAMATPIASPRCAGRRPMPN
jgi:L-Ala-D/L-Glu epimerase